jgi:hypothetical protein
MTRMRCDATLVTCLHTLRAPICCYSTHCRKPSTTSFVTHKDCIRCCNSAWALIASSQCWWVRPEVRSCFDSECTSTTDANLHIQGVWDAGSTWYNCLRTAADKCVQPSSWRVCATTHRMHRQKSKQSSHLHIDKRKQSVSFCLHICRETHVHIGSKNFRDEEVYNALNI